MLGKWYKYLNVNKVKVNNKELKGNIVNIAS